MAMFPNIEESIFTHAENLSKKMFLFPSCGCEENSKRVEYATHPYICIYPAMKHSLQVPLSTETFVDYVSQIKNALVGKSSNMETGISNPFDYSKTSNKDGGLLGTIQDGIAYANTFLENVESDLSGLREEGVKTANYTRRTNAILKELAESKSKKRRKMDKEEEEVFIGE